MIRPYIPFGAGVDRQLTDESARILDARYSPRGESDLPAWVSGVTSTMRTPYFNLEAWGQTDLTGVRTGEILVVADSKGSNFQGAVESWVSQMRRALGAAEGFVQADDGVMDPRWSLVGMSIAPATTVGVQPTTAGTSEVKSAQFVSDESFTGGLLRVRIPGGGSVTLTVDGVAQTVTIPATAGFHAISLGRLTDTPHTVKVESSGELRVAGITLSYPTPRLRISNPARPSSAASDWSTSAADGRWATVTAATAPALIISALGTNEATDLATITAYYDQVAALGVPVVIISPGAIDLSRGREVTNALVNHLYGIAQAHDWVLVDFERVIGAFADADAHGLMFDNLHENTRGMALEALAVLELLVGRTSDGRDEVARGAVSVWGHDLAESVVDAADRVAFGVTVEGEVVAPKLRHAADAVTQSVSSDDLLEGVVDAAGRVGELVMDKRGRVPQWVLDAWRDRMGAIEPGTPDYSTQPMDIFISAGQSNAGHAEEAPAGVPQQVPAHLRPRLFTGSDAAGPVPWPTSESSDGYMEDTVATALAVSYLEAHPDRVVMLVQTNQGSTGFCTTSLSPAPEGYKTVSAGTWDRTLTSDPVNLYTRMITRASGALSRAPEGSRLAVLLWSQGEADYGLRTPAEYTALLTDLITQARIDLNAPTLPVVVGSMVPEYVEANPSSAGLQEALIAMPAAADYVGHFYGPEGLADAPPDSLIHWSWQGQRARGPLAYAALQRALSSPPTGVRAQPPQNLRARRIGGSVLVEWEHPPARVTGMTLEYRIDGGAWTAATLPSALPLRVTLPLAVTATQVVGLRARCTSALGDSHWTTEVQA